MVKVRKPRPGSGFLFAPDRTCSWSNAAGRPRRHLPRQIMPTRCHEPHDIARTVIAALVPKGVFLTNTVPHLSTPTGYAMARAACLGVMNSPIFRLAGPPVHRTLRQFLPAGGPLPSFLGRRRLRPDRPSRHRPLRPWTTALPISLVRPTRNAIRCWTPTGRSPEWRSMRAWPGWGASALTTWWRSTRTSPSTPCRGLPKPDWPSGWRSLSDRKGA